MEELAAASSQLDREGFWWRPELRHGKRSPERPGEWKHGWQYWASSVSDSASHNVFFFANHRVVNVVIAPNAMIDEQRTCFESAPRSNV